MDSSRSHPQSSNNSLNNGGRRNHRPTLIAGHDDDDDDVPLSVRENQNETMYDVDLMESGQYYPSPLHAFTSVDGNDNDDDDDDDDVSISSLALIRKVVRSLNVMPPSVRMQNWMRRDASSPSVSPRRQHQRQERNDCSLYDGDDGNKVVNFCALQPDEVPESTNVRVLNGNVLFLTSSPNNNHHTKKSSNSGTNKTPSLQDTASVSSNISSNTSSDKDALKIYEAELYPNSPLSSPPTPASLSPMIKKKEQRDNYQKPTSHCRRWGHGKCWNILGVVSAIVGSLLAVSSRQSTEFARLGVPMAVAPIYQNVNALGLLQFKVCFNETITEQTGCQTFDLSGEVVDDHIFELSRILLTLAAFMGLFFTFFLILAVFWESINLKPVGFGFLLVYFFQAFSMLFFDAQLCHTYTCQIGRGCIECIAASLCWIITCLATAKMDTQKARLRRRRRRRAKRAAAAAAAAIEAEAEAVNEAIAASLERPTLVKRPSAVPTESSSDGSSADDVSSLPGEDVVMT